LSSIQSPQEKNLNVLEKENKIWFWLLHVDSLLKPVDRCASLSI